MLPRSPGARSAASACRVRPPAIARKDHFGWIDGGACGIVCVGPLVPGQAAFSTGTATGSRAAGAAMPVDQYRRHR